MAVFQIQLTVPTDPRPASVAVSSQSLRIGAPTLAGAGGWRPTLTGSPVYYTISGGNSASYRVNATTGKITPATDSAATTGHAFIFTAYGSIGPGVAATITIAAPANIYSVTSGAEIAAAMLAHIAGSATARAMEMRPGITIIDAVYGEGTTAQLCLGTFRNRLFSAKPLTLTSEDTNNQATIQDYCHRVQGSDSLLFKNYKNTRTSVTGQQTYPIYSDNGNASTTNITIEGCDSQGPSEALLNTLSSPVDWKLFAWQNNGYDSGDVTNPFPSNISFTDAINSTIKNNTGQRLNVGAYVHMQGTVTFEGNDFTSMYYDLYKIDGLSTYDSGFKSIKNNTGSVVLGGRIGSASAIHPDGLQMNGGRLSNAVIDGHVISMGVYGADTLNNYGLQGPFGDNSIYFENVVFRRSLITCQSVHGITCPNTINVLLDQCTLVEGNPNNPVGTGDIPSGRLGNITDTGVVEVRDCIVGGSAFTVNATNQFTESGNLYNMKAGALLTSCFAGPFGTKGRAATIAAWTPIAASSAANIGAVTTAGVLRSDSRKPAVPAKPTLATAAASAITVTPIAAFWAGDSAVTSRDLRYSTDQATWTTMSGVTTPQTTPGLTPTTLYYVQTRDVSAVGAGAWSLSASITTT